MNAQADDLTLISDIYATLNPGGHTARVDKFGSAGMTLRYVTIEKEPPEIKEIILLMDGFVHTLGPNDFTVVQDQELKNARSNGYRLRRVVVQLPNDLGHW